MTAAMTAAIRATTGSGLSDYGRDVVARVGGGRSALVLLLVLAGSLSESLDRKSVV